MRGDGSDEPPGRLDHLIEFYIIWSSIDKRLKLLRFEGVIGWFRISGFKRWAAKSTEFRGRGLDFSLNGVFGA